MAVPAEFVADLRRYVAPWGIRVLSRALEVEKPGEFDGPTVTINPVHPLADCGFYLIHAAGSIYQWSTDFDQARKVFDDLRSAREDRHRHPSRFEDALRQYRRFEERSSDHAVWMLADAGYGALRGPYTVFFRADIEAMTIFHRTGHEPPWPAFYREWKDGIRRGEIWIEPFRPEPVGWFRPVRIEKQEVLQERD